MSISLAISTTTSFRANIYRINLKLKTMKKQLEIYLHGRVQGVNLRRRLASFAKQLRLKGYVENLEDGSVHCKAQGEATALEELLVWCQKLDFPIRLTGMNFNWQDEFEKDYSDFDIKKGGNFIKDEALSLMNLSRNVFSKEKINIPKHVVIIPDGNRRWAREKGWKAWVGHRRAANVERIQELFYECKEFQVAYLTLWGFSTENWDRGEKEVSEIFKVIRDNGPKLKQLFLKENIKFRHLGRKDRLPTEVMDILKDLQESTKTHTKLNFQLCLDYGGRNSIVEAVNKLIQDGVEHVDEKILMSYLDSKDLPEPDLIIRTSGEKRTSGIMPFESIYAELYFTNVYFPDFDSEQFKRAILDYSARKRRFGATHKDDLKNLAEDALVDPDENMLNQPNYNL
jgi:undecaprenyl diphosphate synthase